MENADRYGTSEKHTMEDVRLCQKRLLKMAKEVTKILDEGGYTYCISYGTLLGAVRHGGFIPWDEDFDICLFEDDYDEAVEYLRSNLSNLYIVHDKKSDPIYWPAWAKVRDIKTSAEAECYTDDNLYKYTGLCIDLYKYEKIKANTILSWKKKKAIEYLIRKHDVHVLDDEIYNEKFEKWTQEYSDLLHVERVNATERYVYAMIDTSPDATYEINDIIPLKKYTFEGSEFWGPNDANAILSSFYGDYMSLPPIEKRKVAYKSVHIEEGE